LSEIFTFPSKQLMLILAG